MHPWLREPLIYFVLAGAVVFGADRALQKDDRTIRVTPAVRDEVARAMTAGLGRPPEANELQVGLERWKKEQALFREGLKMGLLEQDPAVRAHLAAKLLEIARNRDVFPEPTEVELRDFLQRHRSSYTVGPTFDFELAFVSKTRGDARAQAEQVLSRLRQGEPPESLGDPFPRGHRFGRESLPEIATLVSDQAAREMPRYVVGEWNLVEGSDGLYALRVTGADRGEPDFDKLRPALALAFDAERRDGVASAFAREVEGRYRFVDSE